MKLTMPKTTKLKDKATKLQELREELLGACARGYTYKENRTKELDSDLIKAMVEELLPIFSKLEQSAFERGREAERKEIKSMLIGEFNRSELQAVVESQARAVGHTYSAINGVKNNNNNALLVIANNYQRQDVDLPKEKTITLEEIKRGFLRGRNLKAMVMDNYALFEVARDMRARIEYVFKILEAISKEEVK